MRAITNGGIATAVTALSAGAAYAQGYAVGRAVEANMGSGAWMVCAVVKHSVKQEVMG